MGVAQPLATLRVVTSRNSLPRPPLKRGRLPKIPFQPFERARRIQRIEREPEARPQQVVAVLQFYDTVDDGIESAKSLGGVEMFPLLGPCAQAHVVAAQGYFLIVRSVRGFSPAFSNTAEI